MSFTRISQPGFELHFFRIYIFFTFLDIFSDWYVVQSLFFLLMQRCRLGEPFRYPEHVRKVNRKVCRDHWKKFCDLQFDAVRDWKKIAKISNHLKDDAKGGMPITNFIRLLQIANLYDEIGIDEISRFCIINSIGDVCHYSNTHKDGKIILSCAETVENLKQKLCI